MKNNKILIFAFILVAGAAFFFIFKAKENIPDGMIGRWTTVDSKYMDRFFELSKETVAFGTGGDHADVYSLSGIQKSGREKPPLYTITFKNSEGVEYSQSFYYSREGGGAIRFKNQIDIVWRKTPGDEI